MKRLKLALLTSIMAVMPLAHADIILQPSTTITAQNVSQIPSDASLEKLVQVQHLEKNLATMMNQSKETVAKAMEASISNLIPKEQITEAQRQQMLEALSEFTQKSMDDLNQSEMRKQMINAYIETAKTVYTQDEVNAMIAFYGSNIGQSVVEKQTIINKAYAEQIMPIIMEKQQSSMKKLLPEFQQKIEKIFSSKTVKHKTGKK